MKKACASDDIPRLFVTGPIDLVARPRLLFCLLCGSDMSLLTNGAFGILQHCQGSMHFPMDQRSQLETLGLMVLFYSKKHMPEDEIERQRVKIMRIPHVRRDQDYRSCDDLNTDEAGVADTQLPTLAKLSPPPEVLRLSGSYELVEQLWAQFF